MKSYYDICNVLFEDFKKDQKNISKKRTDEFIRKTHIDCLESLIIISKRKFNKEVIEQYPELVEKLTNYYHVSIKDIVI